MHLVILDNYQDYLQYRSGEREQPAVFVCFDWFTRDQLHKAGEQAFIYDDYIDRAEGRNKQITVDKLAESWFYDEAGRNRSLFQGVPLGNAMFNLIRFYFTANTRLMMAFVKIIESIKPEEIVTYLKEPDEIVDAERDLRAAIISDIGKYFSVNVRKHASAGCQDIKYFPPLLGYDNFNYSLKEKTFFWLLGLASRLMSVLNRSRRRYKVLLFGNPVHNYFWELWAKSAGLVSFSLNYPIISLPPKKILPMMVWNGVVPFSVKHAGLNGEQLKEREGIRAGIKNIMSSPSWKNKCTVYGVGFHDIFEKIIYAVFVARLDNLSEKVISFQNAFQAFRPDVIIMPNDQVEDERIMIELAAQLGIEVYFWDHGLPQTYVKYDSFKTEPPKCGKMLAWSPHAYRGYLRAGMKAEQLDVLCPPAYERFLPLNRMGEKERVDNVLVLEHGKTHGLLNGRETAGEELLLGLDKLFKKMGVKRIKLKLHPGRGNQEYFRKFIEYNHLSFELCGMHEDTAELMAWADIVVGSITTGFIEAMLIGREYYLVDLEGLGLNGFTDQETDRVVTMAASVEELCELIETGQGQNRLRCLSELMGIDENTQKGGLMAAFTGYFNRKAVENRRNG
jgi:hypothetical protein